MCRRRVENAAAEDRSRIARMGTFKSRIEIESAFGGFAHRIETEAADQLMKVAGHGPIVAHGLPAHDYTTTTDKERQDDQQSATAAFADGTHDFTPEVH
jgi:hypothetical protein